MRAPEPDPGSGAPGHFLYPPSVAVSSAYFWALASAASTDCRRRWPREISWETLVPRSWNSRDGDVLHADPGLRVQARAA